MFLSLETLTSIIRTGLPILVELIDLVNSVIIFLSQMILFRLLTFLLRSLTVILTVLLFCIYFFLLTSICSTTAFPPFRNSDVVISVFIDFPIIAKQDALFHGIVYDYSLHDCDGLCDHLRDVYGSISLNLVFLLLLVNFVSGFRLEVLSFVSDTEKLFAKNFPQNTNLDDTDISLPVFPSRTNLKLHNISITSKMIKKIITDLDLPKASGLDCIPVVVLKNYEPEVSFILAELFKMCLTESCFPDY